MQAPVRRSGLGMLVLRARISYHDDLRAFRQPEFQITPLIKKTFPLPPAKKIPN